MQVESKIHKIQWLEKNVPLSQLRPYEKNPRTITDEQFARLKASLETQGQFMPLLATPSDLLIGGHQRLKAMKELGWKTCRVWYGDREPTPKEYDLLLLLLNHNNGMFDMDALANNYELDFLQGVGLHEVTNIAPMGDDQSQQAGRAMVKCPACQHAFPTKGNKYVAE